MPTKAPPIPVCQCLRLGGFYVGGHVGYAGGTSNWTTRDPAVLARHTRPLSTGLTCSPIPEASSPDFKAATTIVLPYRFVLGAEADASSGFPILSPEPPSAAPRHLPRRSARRAIARRCFRPAQYAAASVTRRALAHLCDRRIRLDLRSGNTRSATGHRHGRHRHFCGDWAGRRGRRRGAGGAALDCARLNICSAISATATTFSRTPGNGLIPTSYVARAASGLELSFRPRRAAGNTCRCRSERRTADICQLSRPDHVTEQVSAFPLTLSGPQSLPARWQGRETCDATPMLACGCGRARNYGSIRRSIRGSGSAARSASPGFRARKLTS